MTKRKRKPVRGRADASHFVPIVGDGAMAGPDRDGRLVPVLIVDSSEHAEVDAVVNAHAHLSPGDVMSNWAVLEDGSGDVVLILNFIRPIEVEILLRFRIRAQAILVDGILASNAVYLQAGMPGDRFSRDIGKPRIIIEVPDGDFNDKWETIFLHEMTTVFSSEARITRRKAQPMARQSIEMIREVSRFRMPQ
jgi:hypothetical protein